MITTVSFNKAFAIYVLARGTAWIVGSLFVNGDTWRISTTGHHDQLEQTIALGLTLLYCSAPIIAYFSNGLRTGTYKREFIDRIDRSGGVALGYAACFLVLTYIPLATKNNVYELAQVLTETITLYASGVLSCRLLSNGFKSKENVRDTFVRGDYREKQGSDGREFMDVDFVARA